MRDVRTSPGFLSPDECAGLVRLWHDTPIPPPRFPAGAALSPQQQAALDWDVRLKAPPLPWLSTRLRETVRATVPDCDGVVDNLVLVRWLPGEDMALHSDFGAWGEFPNRHFAAVVFLNEDFGGGEHYFADGEIAPVTGTLLVHPGGTLRHGVRTVRERPRYTATCWFGSA